MKRAFALLALVCLPACSFPEFAVRDVAVGDCGNGKRDGAETGVDCGLSACGRGCALGDGCGDDSDCAEGGCLTAVCRLPEISCDDGIVNGTETDEDCGGNDGCAPCATGKICELSRDCDGGECGSGRCRAPTCTDKLVNGAETAVDCGGGACGPCTVGEGCDLDRDCDSGACRGAKCQTADCDDAVQNQDETDLDCGGSCQRRCADDLGCKADVDCTSGVCSPELSRCAAASCTDGVLNGSEPSLDCGAECPTKCGQLDPCNRPADCETASCVDDRCVPAEATGEKLSTLGWLASASHTSSPQTNSPQFALDGAQSTDWATGTLQTLGMWFEIDMRKEQVFFSIEVDSINQPSDAAEAFNVEVSADGKFTEPPVLENYPAKKSQLVITFPKVQVGRYVRFTLTSAGDKWWRMDEIRVRQ